MNLQKKLLTELHEWDKNPRTISPQAYERLKYQITKLHDYKPLLITPDGMVIGGNMRLKAYRELGLTETMVSIVEPKDESELWEYALSDNDHAGKTDMDTLANMTPQLSIDWGKYAVDVQDNGNVASLLKAFGEGEYTPDVTIPHEVQPGYEELTFTLTKDQAAFIKTCLAKIPDTADSNNNSAALVTICQQWDAAQKTI